MREIKFRAWDKRKKIIGEVNYIKFSKAQYTHISVRLKKGEKIIDEGHNYGAEDGSDNVILMQYTGLKDKNGKEIYEGDILVDDRGKKYLIKWGINSNGFIGKTNEIHCNVYSSYHLSFKTEVIGNIHENPELLEVK